MDFEDVLLDVGDYGKYQKRLIWLFLFPVSVIIPWLSMSAIFQISTPDHWCYVPEVAFSNLSVSEQKFLVGPSDSEFCMMYDVNYTEFILSGNYTIPNDTSTIPCNNGWQYDKTNYDSTITTQWNLVCSDDHYTKMVLLMGNVGSIIGTPVYGALSDRIGRRIVFFITVIVTFASGVACILVTNFIAHLVLQAVHGTLMPSLFQIPFIIILEVVAPEMRTRMNAVANCTWVIGLCILPLIAYLSRTWIILGAVSSVVTLPFFLYWKFLPESPRWLLSQGRYEEAVVIMSKIGKTNGKPQDPNILLQKLQKLGKKMKEDEEKDGIKNSVFDLLRYPQLRKKFLIITFCWIADTSTYYGLTINVENLEGNEFIVFFLLSLAEAPGYFTSWYFMERLGRRWCAVVAFFLLGISCILAPLGIPYGDVVFSMLGKYFSGAAFMATYQQSSELYPTVLRSLGMGMSGTLAGIFTLVVPYIIYLNIYGKAIPFLIIGITAILAGFAATLLPETLNENLPQTIPDAEKFGREQKFFSWNRRKISVSKERASIRRRSLDPNAGELTVQYSLETLQNSDFILNEKNARNTDQSKETSDEKY